MHGDGFLCVVAGFDEVLQGRDRLSARLDGSQDFVGPSRLDAILVEQKPNKQFVVMRRSS